GLEGEVISGNELWTYDRATGRLVWTGVQPRSLARMAARGVAYAPPYAPPPEPVAGPAAVPADLVGRGTTGDTTGGTKGKPGKVGTVDVRRNGAGQATGGR